MLIQWIEKHREWSKETFGEGPHTEGLCRHIEKELDEIRENPKEIMEWIDVIILALDGAWRAGHTPQEIVAALENKRRINEARKWQKKVKGQPAEHVREPADPSRVASGSMRDAIEGPPPSCPKCGEVYYSLLDRVYLWAYNTCFLCDDSGFRSGRLVNVYLSGFLRASKTKASQKEQS